MRTRSSSESGDRRSAAAAAAASSDGRRRFRARGGASSTASSCRRRFGGMAGTSDQAHGRGWGSVVGVCRRRFVSGDKERRWRRRCAKAARDGTDNLISAARAVSAGAAVPDCRRLPVFLRDGLRQKHHRRPSLAPRGRRSTRRGGPPAAPAGPPDAPARGTPGVRASCLLPPRAASGGGRAVRPQTGTLSVPDLPRGSRLTRMPAQRRAY